MKKVITLLALFCVAVFAQNTFTDPRDGKKYKTTKIGSQIWFAENLNYDVEGSKCGNNEPENCKKYGRLYNWNAAMKSCPKDWHLPSNEEWQILVDFVGGEKIAGKKLKAKSGWDADEGKSGNGTDNYGFSALPGGLGSGDYFDHTGITGDWWSASENESYRNFSYHRYMRHDYEHVGGDGSFKSSLFSVRCVKD